MLSAFQPFTNLTNPRFLLKLIFKKKSDKIEEQKQNLPYFF